MDRFGVAVLSILNKKNHEESDDSGASVDNELPGIGEMKGRSRHPPHHNDEEGADKRPGRSQHLGRFASKATKAILRPTKNIPVPRFFAVIQWHGSSFHRSGNHVCASSEPAESAANIDFRRF